LLVVAAVVIVVAYNFVGIISEGPRSFLLNLSTEIIGILLTVGLIDSVIRRREHEERQRYKAVALQRLYHPLTGHFRLLSLMYKASVKVGSDNPSWSLDDFIKEDFKNQLAHLDLLGPSPSIRGLPKPMYQEEWENVPWHEYLHMEAKEFREALERVTEKYSMQLDSETAGVIEDLANSSFMNQAIYHFPHIANMFRETASSRGVHIPMTILTAPGDTELINHVNGFVRLVHSFNEAVSNNYRITTSTQKVWRGDITPSVGSSRASIKYEDPETGDTIVEE
jgi:hypothetical protein